jgi:hypothetical protein
MTTMETSQRTARTTSASHAPVGNAGPALATNRNSVRKMSRSEMTSFASAQTVWSFSPPVASPHPRRISEMMSTITVLSAATRPVYFNRSWRNEG